MENYKICASAGRTYEDTGRSSLGDL